MGAFPTTSNQTFTVSFSKSVLYLLDETFTVWYRILSHFVITVLMGKLERQNLSDNYQVSG